MGFVGQAWPRCRCLVAAACELFAGRKGLPFNGAAYQEWPDTGGDLALLLGGQPLSHEILNSWAPELEAAVTEAIHRHLQGDVTDAKPPIPEAGRELIERHLLRVTLGANEVVVHLRQTIADGEWAPPMLELPDRQGRYYLDHLLPRRKRCRSLQIVSSEWPCWGWQPLRSCRALRSLQPHQPRDARGRIRQSPMPPPDWRRDRAEGC